MSQKDYTVENLYGGSLWIVKERGGGLMGPYQEEMLEIMGDPNDPEVKALAEKIATFLNDEQADGDAVDVAKVRGGIGMAAMVLVKRLSSYPYATNDPLLKELVDLARRFVNDETVNKYGLTLSGESEEMSYEERNADKINEAEMWGDEGRPPAPGA